MTADIAIGIVLLLIILSAAAVKGGDFLGIGKNARAYADTAQIAAAISQYKFEIGSYPSGLDKLAKKEGQYGPWLSAIKTDPWGQSYVYQKNDDGFAVWSMGSDHKTNGSSVSKIGNGDIGYLGK